MNVFYENGHVQDVMYADILFDQPLLKVDGHVQEWTDLLNTGDPKPQLRPVAPQASAVHSRAAPFQA
jgi:hypothetical protein